MPKPPSAALLGQLLQALQNGAVAAPTWHLDHRARWRWLAATLLGHPPVRGGQRPRDFPADPAGRLAVDVAVALQALPLDTWNRHRLPEGPPFRLGTWLYAFTLLMEGAVLPQAPGRTEALCQEAVQWVLLQVLRGLGLGTDEGACQRLLAALGLGLRDGGPLTDPPLGTWGSACHLAQDPDNPVAAAAEAAALLARLEAAQTREGRGALPAAKNPLARRLLADTRLWLVTVKTHRVQAYLERAREVWVTRGASVWAAEALAFVREELLAGVPSLVLLADVDALARFACFEAPACDALRALLQRRIREVWSARGLAGGALALRHPRLASFLECLPAATRKAAVDRLASTLPEFALEVSGPLTLADLCRRRSPGVEPDGARRFLRRPARPAPGVPCDFVRRDLGLVAKNLVPWMHPEREARSMGMTGLVWSLAGAAFRMHVAQGIAALAGPSGMPLRPGTHAWLADLGEAEGRVAYLKLDGDRVGATLGGLPLLRALGAGLELHARTYAGLRAAILAARDPASPVLPVEVIYQGGDDLLCVVPEVLLDRFLRGFAAPAPTPAAATCTGAAITLDGRLVRLGSGAPLLVARMVPVALEWAKRRSRGLPCRAQERRLRTLAAEQGFGLELASVGRRFGRQLEVWVAALTAVAGPVS